MKNQGFFEEQTENFWQKNYEQGLGEALFIVC